MARNNEERLGAKQSTAAPPIDNLTQPSTDTPQSSVLSFTAPTEFVALPSEGKFYPQDHPLHNEETVEIRYMTAKDEDILTSKALLKKGVAIDRLLQNIIIDKRVKLDDLLVGDKNAILVAARVSGYGTEYLTNVTCPNCGEVSEYKFDLSEINISSVNEETLSDANVTLTDGGTFVYTLPKSGFEVEMRLLCGKDERTMLNIMKASKKSERPDEILTGQLKQILVSVDGISDRPVINQFVDVMPAMDARSIRNVYSLTMPNVDLTQLFECSECDQETTMEVPFGATFLWPK